MSSSHQLRVEWQHMQARHGCRRRPPGAGGADAAAHGAAAPAQRAAEPRRCSISAQGLPHGGSLRCVIDGGRGWLAPAQPRRAAAPHSTADRISARSAPHGPDIENSSAAARVQQQHGEAAAASSSAGSCRCICRFRLGHSGTLSAHAAARSCVCRPLRGSRGGRRMALGCCRLPRLSLFFLTHHGSAAAARHFRSRSVAAAPAIQRSRHGEA